MPACSPRAIHGAAGRTLAGIYEPPKKNGFVFLSLLPHADPRVSRPFLPQVPVSIQSWKRTGQAPNLCLNGRLQSGSGINLRWHCVHILLPMMTQPHLGGVLHPLFSLYIARDYTYVPRCGGRARPPDFLMQHTIAEEPSCTFLTPNSIHPQMPSECVRGGRRAHAVLCGMVADRTGAHGPSLQELNFELN